MTTSSGAIVAFVDLTESITEPEPNNRLPSFEDFIALVEDEKRATVNNPSGYSVYHKYNKSC